MLQGRRWTTGPLMSDTVPTRFPEKKLAGLVDKTACPKICIGG